MTTDKQRQRYAQIRDDLKTAHDEAHLKAIWRGYSLDILLLPEAGQLGLLDVYNVKAEELRNKSIVEKI